MPPTSGPTVLIRMVGGKELAAHWMREVGTIDAETFEITKMCTRLLKENVKTRASGPPGPSIQTGNYVRSVKSDVYRYEGNTIGTVYSDLPYGRRLEFGFVGADAQGRQYHQAPRPHWRPALADIETVYVQAIGGVVNRI